MQDSKSSLPLVDFISKWRSNHSVSVGHADVGGGNGGLAGAESEVTPNSPLLLNTKYVSSPSSPGTTHPNETDVPYPAPESFLPGRVPPDHLVSGYDTDSDLDDSDDEAQSIKSYSSDHIRTYDRLSLSRVTSGDSDSHRDEIIDIPYLDQELPPTKNRRLNQGCFNFTTRLCWSRAKSEESIELQETRFSDKQVRDSKKNKLRNKRSRFV